MEIIYYGVDKHGNKRHVNSVSNEDDDVHEQAEDVAKECYGRDFFLWHGIALCCG